jgi:hypothetical protein
MAICNTRFRLSFELGRIMGALLITAIHSLIQFFLRPADNTPLVFACICLLLFLRECTVEHMSFALSALAGGFVLITKLNFFSFYASIPTALYCFHLSYRQQFRRQFCILIYVVCVVFAFLRFLFYFSLHVILVPQSIFSKVLQWLLCFICCRECGEHEQ